MYGNGKIALADSLDIVTAELEMLIDRHFAVRRELVVSNDEVKFWTAAIGDNVLYRSPNRASVLRFATAFCDKPENANVHLIVLNDTPQHSVHVDNVVHLTL